MRPRGWCVAMLCAWVCGCTTPAAPPQDVELRVALTDDCQPGDDAQLTLVAEGHYPARDALFVPLRPEGQPQTLPPFPGDTLAYRLEARGDAFDGAGRVKARTGRTLDVLVLPFSRPCNAARLASGRFEQGAGAPLGDTELLWLGAAANAGTLRVSASRGRVSAPAEPLFVPRAGASVTPLGDAVVVAGGRQGEAADAPALANFEQLDPAREGFDEVGRLEVARADHAAAQSADGVVWLAGGRDGGRRLASLERLGFGKTDAELQRPSDALALRALDDGSMVALDFARGETPAVQHFDPAGSARVDAAELPLATRPGLVVALPGARLLAFEVDDDGRTTGRACLRFGLEGDTCLDDWVTSFAGLVRARAVALRDGRVLLLGERDGSPALRVVDVGRLVVEVQSAPFVPQWAGLLGDGSVALVGEDTVALLREDALSPTAELPATLLAPDAPMLALDSVTHWRWEGLSLVAIDDRAEAHLAAVRLSDLALEVEADGDVDVVFGWPTGETRTLRIEAGRVDLFGSELAREPAERVHLERRGERWRAWTESASSERVTPGLMAPARLSLRAPDSGTRITRFTLRRL